MRMRLIAMTALGLAFGPARAADTQSCPSELAVEVRLLRQLLERNLQRQTSLALAAARTQRLLALEIRIDAADEEIAEEQNRASEFADSLPSAGEEDKPVILKEIQKSNERAATLGRRRSQLAARWEEENRQLQLELAEPAGK